ncbi:hypothetical protein [Bradyrhizobium sp. Leo121]|uniref:hypothetical protein n=1 Tax=Bradyrhizobium sp. Leo121 TaxID=1571195 RepID=UPI0013EF3FF4
MAQSQRSGGASSVVSRWDSKMPAAVTSTAGIDEFRDDVLMLLICPTRQRFLERTSCMTAKNKTSLEAHCGTVELAGCAGFGPGGAGSIDDFGSVGMTVAPAARAASPVVE